MLRPRPAVACFLEAIEDLKPGQELKPDGGVQD